MKPFFALLALLAPFFCVAAPLATATNTTATTAFIQNNGQIADQFLNRRQDIDFKLSSPGMAIFGGDGMLHYQWESETADLLHMPGSQNNTRTAYRMDVVLVGCNRDVVPVFSEKQNYSENYYLPQCPEGVTASSFSRVTYRNVYPNIDWVLYTGSGALKYDFVVRPGGKPQIFASGMKAQPLCRFLMAPLRQQHLRVPSQRKNLIALIKKLALK